MALAGVQVQQLESRNYCGELEHHHNKLEGVDVDITNGRWLCSPSTLDYPLGPGDVEPEPESLTVGPSSKETGVSSGVEVRSARDHKTQRDLPRSGVCGNVGQELA